MEATENLNLPYLMPSQAQKHVTHNEALRALDALIQIAVCSRTVEAPPSAPGRGDRYIVPDGATDAWAGHDQLIAAWQDGAWMFHTPRSGCPACIREDMESGEGPPPTRPWLRSAWSIKLVRTCPKHRMLLVEPALEIPVYFRQDVAVICQNREAIEAMSVIAEPVPASPFEDWMATRLDGCHGGSDYLASLAFHAAVRFTEVIGASAVFGKFFTITDFTETQFVDAGRAGFEIAAPGPDAIRSYLDSILVDFRQTHTHLGGKIMLGSMYGWLGQTKDGDIDPLRDLIRDYVIDKYPIGPGDWFMGTVTRRRWHSIHTAYKESGIHPKRLRKLLMEAGFISLQDAALTDHKVKFDAESVVPFLRQWRDGFSKREAQAHAGMSYSQLWRLVEAGFIRPLANLPGNSRVEFSSEDIDAFLASVLYDTGDGDPTEMVDVTTATRMAECFLSDIVHMVVDRKLARVALSPSLKGFAGLLVDPKEVLALLPPRREKKGLTTAEASKRLGLRDDVVRALMAAGHILTVPTGKFAHGREVCHIPEKEVEAFVARYASLWDVAQSLGSRSRWKTNARLAAAGIRPTFDRATYGADVYERAAVALGIGMSQ